MRNDTSLRCVTECVCVFVALLYFFFLFAAGWKRVVVVVERGEIEVGGGRRPFNAIRAMMVIRFGSR